MKHVQLCSSRDSQPHGLQIGKPERWTFLVETYAEALSMINIPL